MSKFFDTIPPAQRMVSSPCYKCPDRTLTCDSTCEKFKKYKIELQKAKDMRHKIALDRKDKLR